MLITSESDFSLLTLAEMQVCLIMTNEAAPGQVHTDLTPGQVAPSTNASALSSLCLWNAGHTCLQSSCHPLTVNADALKDESQHGHRVVQGGEMTVHGCRVCQVSW